MKAYGVVKRVALYLGLAVAALASSTAQAGDFDFTITDGPASYFYGRTQLTGGTVTGVIKGLSTSGWSDPTSIEITSADPGLGFTLGAISNPLQWGGDGFEVVNGQIVDANFDFNFTDAAGNAFQLRLDDQTDVSGANWLFWNGGATPVAGVGNTAGFAGATYSSLSAVPEPATWLLAVAGLGLVWTTRRARKDVVGA